MTQLILNRKQVRDVDRIAIEEYGIPGIVLMENAGRGTAELLLRQQLSGTVLVLCGKGNNGGDGFVIARHLDNAGQDVRIALFSDPSELTGDAATNYHIANKMGIPIEVLSIPADVPRLQKSLSNVQWIVDALLGTGTSGRARDPYLTVIETVNAAGKIVLAVDVPSGLDCDSGPVPDATIRANLTATFVAAKPGLVTEEAGEYVGKLEIVDIGAPRNVLTRDNSAIDS